jgi:hypothetical protein
MGSCKLLEFVRKETRYDLVEHSHVIPKSAYATLVAFAVLSQRRKKIAWALGFRVGGRPSKGHQQTRVVESYHDGAKAVQVELPGTFDPNKSQLERL